MRTVWQLEVIENRLYYWIRVAGLIYNIYRNPPRKWGVDGNDSSDPLSPPSMLGVREITFTKWHVLSLSLSTPSVSLPVPAPLLPSPLAPSPPQSSSPSA